MLHLQLVAGVSGMAHAHSLWFEDVDLKKIAGCQLLNPGLVSSQLHFARLLLSSSFFNLVVSYCNTIDMTCSNISR